MVAKTFVRLHEERVRTLQRRARDEAFPCIICGQAVHPVNVSKHFQVHHPDKVLTANSRNAKTQSNYKISLTRKLRNAYTSNSHVFIDVRNWHTTPTPPPQNIVQMPLMPQAQILDHHTDTLAYHTIDLLQAALAGDYNAADQALASIQHEMHRATQGDPNHRNDYSRAVQNSVICSEWRTIINEVA